MNDNNADEGDFDRRIKAAAELNKLDAATLSLTDDVKQEWDRQAALPELAERLKTHAKNYLSQPDKAHDTLLRIGQWFEKQPWGQPGWLTADRENELLEWESELVRVGVGGVKGNPTPGRKKEPALRAQERVILETLVKLSYNPKDLPDRKDNDPGAKAAVWEILVLRIELFGSRRVFDKAWERLRAPGGGICGGK